MARSTSAMLKALLAWSVMSSVVGLDVTPMQKVVQLLADLKKNVLAEGEEELETYRSYLQFCKKTKAEKATAIQKGQDAKDLLESSIEASKAKYESKLAKIQEVKVNIESLSSKRDARKKECRKDKVAFETNNADLNSAVSALAAAMKKIKDSGTGDAWFLQLGSTLRLANALGFNLGKAKPWLEEEGAEHSKSKYDFQSSGIVATLESLHKQFTQEQEDSSKNWKEAEANCIAAETDSTRQIDTKTDELSTAKQDAASLKGDIARDKESLLGTTKDLEEDTAYRADLVKTCDARDKDWEQRAAQRTDEVKALDQATDILTDEVEAIDKSVSGAKSPTLLLNSAAHAAAPKTQSLLMTEAGAPAASFLQRSHTGLRVRTAGKSSHSALKAKVADQLASAASRLGSARLLGLSKRIATAAGVDGDPLVGVKELVSGMLKDLLTEKQNETTEKGFCDTELRKAKTDRQKFSSRVSRTNAKLNSLEASRVSFVGEVDVLSDTIDKLTEEHATATTLRDQTSAENLKTIKDSNAAVKAVEKAMDVIKDFYKQAGNSWALLQQAQKPPPAVKGEYKGKQAGSLGIITMMETCRDDFARTAETTQASEKVDAEDFAKLDQDTKEDIAGKTTNKQLAEEDLASTVNDLKEGKLELKSNMDSLDAALERLMELKPRCVDPKESFEVLRARRKGQITALQQALCALDSENVEASCQGSSE